MRKYHTLTVDSLDSETRDSLRVALNVPENLREVFVFKPGQHLPIQLAIDGKLVRRTYSICSVSLRVVASRQFYRLCELCSKTSRKAGLYFSTVIVCRVQPCLLRIFKR